LIEAAYATFSETGIRDAPVELICDRAGFTRGAFYSNFASKEELFLAVYEVQMGDRADRLRAAVESALATVDPSDGDSVAKVLQNAVVQFMESPAADETWYLLGLRLTVDPHAAVITVIALYETMLQRALLNESLSSADNSFVSEVLPRVLAALVTPKTGETS